MGCLDGGVRALLDAIGTRHMRVKFTEKRGKRHWGRKDIDCLLLKRLESVAAVGEQLLRCEGACVRQNGSRDRSYELEDGASEKVNRMDGFRLRGVAEARHIGLEELRGEQHATLKARI